MTTARPRHAARILAGVLVCSMLVTGWAAPGVARAQSGCEASTISAPRSGDVVRGSVEILGSASIDAFNFYKLEWASRDDPEQWIAVSEVIAAPVRNGRLDTWPTIALADGDYRLKLTVVDDTFGERCRFTVERLRVANDAPLATEEPATSRAFATAAATREAPPEAVEEDGRGSAAPATKPPGAAAQGDEPAPGVDGQSASEQDVDPEQGQAERGGDSSPKATAAATTTAQPTPRPTLEPVLPQSDASASTLPRGMGRSFAIGLLLAMLAGLGLAVLLLRR